MTYKYVIDGVLEIIPADRQIRITPGTPQRDLYMMVKDAWFDDDTLKRYPFPFELSLEHQYAIDEVKSVYLHKIQILNDWNVEYT